MRLRHTALEEELLRLPEDQRAAALHERWQAFRGSPHLDFVVMVLRDVERQALTTIRERPTADLRGSAMALHVVDLIRRAFVALDTGPEPAAVDWFDDEDFLPEEESRA